MRNSRWERTKFREGYRFIAGVDEAGRGPLAGPVVAAAVIFSKLPLPFDVDDSKKLTAKQRTRLFNLIMEYAHSVGVGIVSHKTIDEVNILQATYLAMTRAVASLPETPDFVFVDGRGVPLLSIPRQAIVKGDQKSVSIAAASIVAKVIRDRLMEKYDRQFPDYAFARHKGYPTRRHIEAIRRHGFCEIHRRSFKIKQLS
ncbi:MAG: ribonuclease HII [Calditrichaeota bacterium]|nr:ribonuclease HII [Calditrichota bacterium]